LKMLTRQERKGRAMEKIITGVKKDQEKMLMLKNFSNFLKKRELILSVEKSKIIFKDF